MHLASFNRKDYLQAHVRRIHPEVGNSPESSDSNLLVDFMSMADSANIDQKESKVFSMDASSNFGLHQSNSTFKIQICDLPKIYLTISWFQQMKRIPIVNSRANRTLLGGLPLVES